MCTRGKILPVKEKTFARPKNTHAYNIDPRLQLLQALKQLLLVDLTRLKLGYQRRNLRAFGAGHGPGKGNKVGQLREKKKLQGFFFINAGWPAGGPTVASSAEDNCAPPT
jgi:hypothetical protein